MRYELQQFARYLREARLAKNLTQRELSELSGVPQAQISRIEANEVDLRLSTLTALANALELELALIPRKASPAVKALTQQVTKQISIQPLAIEKELRRLHKAIRELAVQNPPLPQVNELRKLFTAISSFPLEAAYLEELCQIRRAAERARAVPQEAGGVVLRLQALYRQLAQAYPQATLPEESRPAYSLDEDTDAD